MAGLRSASAHLLVHEHECHGRGHVAHRVGHRAHHLSGTTRCDSAGSLPSGLRFAAKVDFRGGKGGALLTPLLHGGAHVRALRACVACNKNHCECLHRPTSNLYGTNRDSPRCIYRRYRISRSRLFSFCSPACACAVCGPAHIRSPVHRGWALRAVGVAARS
jgi:hypothetical protein